MRVAMIQEAVLSKWSHFTIWNAGKQGRRFYRSLHPDNQAKAQSTTELSQSAYLAVLFKLHYFCSRSLPSVIWTTGRFLKACISMKRARCSPLCLMHIQGFIQWGGEVGGGGKLSPKQPSFPQKLGYDR